MRNVLIFTILALGATVTAQAQCGDNGKFIGLGRAGDILCTGKTGAAGYSTPFVAVSTLTVTAASHGQGLLPAGFCYDNSVPALLIAQTATYPQVAANGNITFAWTGTKTGTCLISALGSSKGDTGVKGDSGSNGQSVASASEAPGVNCATGGTKFTSISGINYVCNGPAGVGFTYRGTYALRPGGPSVWDTMVFTDGTFKGWCDPTNFGAGGSELSTCTWNGSAFSEGNFAVDSTKTLILPGPLQATGPVSVSGDTQSAHVPVSGKPELYFTPGTLVYQDGAGSYLASAIQGIADPADGESWVGVDGVQNRILRVVTTPANSNTSCSKGQTAVDSGYVYLCYDTNAWARAVRSAWATAAPDPTVDNSTGTYSDVVSVTASDSLSGALICGTLDGSDPTIGAGPSCSHGTDYTSTPASITSTGTVLKLLAAKNTFTNSNIVSFTYTLTAVDPIFSPTAGTYPTAQTVTVTSPGTSSPVFCYRTDGVSPAVSAHGTCAAGSTTYSSNISVPSGSVTIKMLTTKAGIGESNIITKTYTISTTPPSLVTKTGFTNSSLTQTFTSTGSGHTLVLIVAGNIGSGTSIASISGCSATWALAASSHVLRYSGIWVGTGVASGCTSLVMTLSSGSVTNVQGSIMEWANMTGTVESVQSANSNTATPSVTVTPTNVNRAIFASIRTGGAPTLSASPTSPWNISFTQYGSSAWWAAYIDPSINSTTAIGYTASWTMSGSAAFEIAGVAIY